MKVVVYAISKNEEKFVERWVKSMQEADEIYVLDTGSTDNTIDTFGDAYESRSNYLPLLELSIKENSENDRNMHYLGREYMYYGKWNEAIDTLIKHIHLNNATWNDEKCASMRFIGRCYIQLERYDEAEFWFNKAIKEAPYLRDSYMEKAMLFYKQEKWNDLIQVINEALKIKSHEKTYINEVFSWNETPYDLLSIAYYNIQNYNKALDNVNLAIKINCHNKRLKANKKVIINTLKMGSNTNKQS